MVLGMILAATTVTCAWLAWRCWRLSGHLRALEAQLERLAASGLLEGPSLPALPAERPTLITIEILNPMELAMRESRLAGPVGALAPGLIQAEVMRQALQKVRQQLEAEGVEAEVRLVRAR